MAGLRKLDVSIIGMGNWGSSLAAALAHAGTPACEIILRRKRLKAITWDKAALDARILWLCVPDSSISHVAAQIALRRPGLHGKVVVHSSGALTVDALDPARRAGAAVASVHPAMTFPTRNPVPLEGVLFGIEAPEPAARRTLDKLVRHLGGLAFNITSKNKALYHAAGTLASPLLVSELTAAIATARLAGLDRRNALRWVESLATATSRNVFNRGPARSFSGPFARGDASTIELHLRALHAHPILAGLYRSLAVYALESLPAKNRRELEQVLIAPQSSTQNKQAQKRA
ncbi:MAG: DUF2520 domain-containing protein [Silvibacterium sp.]|nr:DUF2520 domain-containing protein [Silvibacterium sp.]